MKNAKIRFCQSILKFGFLFLELLERYINTLPTLTQLPTGEDDDEHTNEIEFRRPSEKFVGDFNKFFKDLEAWTSNDVHIQTWKDHFLKEYPKMLGDSSGTEMDVDIDTTMRTKPPIEREEKLRKVEEKL